MIINWSSPYLADYLVNPFYNHGGKIIHTTKLGYYLLMDDDIGLDLLSMAVCFDFRSTNIVQLSNQNPYFYRF